MTLSVDPGGTYGGPWVHAEPVAGGSDMGPDDAGLDHAIGMGVPGMLAAPGTLPLDEPLTLAFCTGKISEAFLAAYEREVRLKVVQRPFLSFTF